MRNEIAFGTFVFDLQTRELSDLASRTPLALQPKPSLILATLLLQPGKLVTREALYAAGWGDTTVSYDLALNTCIRQIRDTLGDRAEDPRFIQTVPRRGYRFIAPIRRLQPRRPRPLSTRLYTIGKKHIRPLGMATAFVCATLVFVLSALLGSADHTPTVEIEAVRILEADANPGLAMTGAVLEDHIRTTAVNASTGRLSILSEHGRPLTLQGERHQADYLITSSLHPAPDGYRLTVQIVRATDRVVLWAGEFNPYCPDVNDPVRVIARLVASALVRSSLPGNDLFSTASVSDAQDFLHPT